MRTPLRTVALVAGLICAGAVGRSSSTAASPPHDDKAIVHVLNRVGFGPRPGDIARVRTLGIQGYIDQQLHPDRVSDDGMSPRLDGLATVSMSQSEIVSRFAIPELQARREMRQKATQRTGDETGNAGSSPEMRRQANQLIVELSQQKLLRAVYSERQLQEVLTDFWFNHFNVDARKGLTRFLVTEYERDAIRPRVLGSFRDLLGATARSPAMLFYLDNWLSADPDAAGGRRGLNENYARELMELHTLGVDGGFTQQDVTEVARAFTGWTIDRPMKGGGFRFDARLHDSREKLVLGHRLKAGGGESDGEQVLDILANHPSTARFIATKLAKRFVSDTPPASLVDRATARFRDTHGDLREVMRTILFAPEFYEADAYRAKVKSPFEFLVSTLRATGAEVHNPAPLVRTLHEMGMPPYLCQPPTGYADSAEAWLNAGALVNRMNTALALANGSLRGVSLGGSILRDEHAMNLVEIQRTLVASALADDISPATRATMSRAETVPQLAALVLGSPEFQKR